MFQISLSQGGEGYKLQVTPERLAFAVCEESDFEKRALAPCEPRVSKYRWGASFARSAHVHIVRIIEGCELHYVVAQEGKGVMVAVAACTMTLSVPSHNGERSSWRIRLLLVLRTGGRESWRSNKSKFRRLSRNAMFVKIIENKTCSCEDRSSVRDDG